MKEGRRKDLRLNGWDYTERGAYFITLCSFQRKPVFGGVSNGEVRLSPIGRLVEAEWRKTGEIRKEIRLDERIIMPNHMHAIVFIERGAGRQENPARMAVGATGRSPLRSSGPTPRSLASMVAGFKSSVTTRARMDLDFEGGSIWQRNYFEKVVRSENHLDNLRRYIRNNPMKWELDRYYSP